MFGFLPTLGVVLVATSGMGRQPQPEGQEMGEPIKLNIGAGLSPIEGWESVDREHGKEAYPLDYADESVDQIRASHILEHFGWADVSNVVKDWVRVLKPGGWIKIAVPNFAALCQIYHHKLLEPQKVFLAAYGGQVDQNDFHKSCFDEKSLRALMRSTGLEQIKPWKDKVIDSALYPFSLNLEGYKPFPREPIQIPKIVCLLSMPKLAWTENVFCTTGVCMARNIDVTKYTGAYWAACLDRLICDAMKTDAEWIFTADYDSVYTGPQFDELCRLLATHPEIDAIAPWQCKRETDTPLCCFADEKGEKRQSITMAELEDEVVPARTAHFGCTLIRISAIKKMPLPWFVGKPDPEGHWNDGRIDEDIHFWHQFAEAGNVLALAGRVSVGHLQMVVTWPDDGLYPVHQYISDFQQNGPLEGIRQ